jgi:hypothetical protein
MSLLPRRPQERLRTRPSLACLVRVEQVGVWMHKPDQVGGIQIPLHPDAPPLTVVDAERERFLCDAATLTGLGAFRRACGDAVYLPASTFSQTDQDLHKQPWRTTLDAPTKATLPRPVGDRLQQNRTPLTNDLMRQAARPAFAMGGTSSLPIRKPRVRAALPLRRAPVPPAFPPVLDGAVGPVVIRVIGTPLSLAMPLVPPDLGCLRVQIGTEWLQPSSRFRDHRQSGRTQIPSHGSRSAGVRRLVVGRARADELDPEAAPLPHPPPDQPDVFYGCSESMRQHQITERAAGQLGWKGQPAPDDPIAPPDQAGLIALPFHRVQLVLALEAHPLGVSHRPLPPAPPPARRGWPASGSRARPDAPQSSGRHDGTLSHRPGAPHPDSRRLPAPR